MKKLLLALGLAACTPAHADLIQITIPCEPTPVVFELMKEYENGLLLSGTGTIKSENGENYTSATQLFINQDTGTMAMIITFPNEDKPSMSCLVIAGEKWEPYGGPQPWDKKKEEL
jgi:hypothetical protein